MSNKNSMTIDIQSDSIQITQVKDGISSVKQTNLRAVQEVLTKDKSLQTPILPSLWGTQFYAKNNDRELYVISTPPHIRDVKYDNSREGDATQREDVKSYRVPMPGLLWFIIARNRPGTEQREYVHGMAYAIKQQVLSGKDLLYRYPFANVDNRWMCWGQEPAPAIGAAKGVQMIPEHFLGMNFNHHLDDHKFEPFKAEVEGREISLFRTLHLFRHMDQELKKDENFQFPYNALKRSTTLQEAIDRHIQEFLR